VEIGDIIPFGGYDWRVLDVRGGAALLITADIIEQREYHSSETPVTWEKCGLRHYLNGEFYDKFNQTDKARIIEVTNQNPDNQWYGTLGGNDTTDKIFLLSLDEVCRYFGDSSEKLQNQGSGYFGAYIDDINDRQRVSRINGEIGYEDWWWLRSPGKYDTCAAGVNRYGCVLVNGCGVNYKYCGVRPALWVSLEVKQ